jgi:hypothetical protein
MIVSVTSATSLSPLVALFFAHCSAHHLPSILRTDADDVIRAKYIAKKREAQRRGINF